MSNARFNNIAHSNTIIDIILDDILKDYEANSMLQYLPVLTLIKCGMFSTAVEYLNGLTLEDEQMSTDRDTIVRLLQKYDAFSNTVGNTVGNTVAEEEE